MKMALARYRSRDKSHDNITDSGQEKPQLATLIKRQIHYCKYDMNPVLLQKQFRDNSKDLQDFYKELQEWGDEMKRKDESCKSGTASDAEVRLPKVQKTDAEEDAKKPEVKKPKRIKSCDYKAWEKFDADGCCKQMDKETVAEPLSDDASDDLSDEFDITMVDLANCEKNKGNAFVKKQRWDDAIRCYTKAIESYAYDPIFYANRALCHLKKQSYRNAESDCTAALQLDKTYVKAYQRRAAARESLNQLNEARDDLLRVLELEKKNAESKAALVKVEKKIEATRQPVAEPSRPVSKFTLARQKQKPVSEVAHSINEDIPAIKPHVMEKLKPVATSTSLPTEFNINGEVPATKPGIVEKLEPATTSTSLPVKFKQWPSGDRIELFESLSRPHKPKSGRPLKRIEITEVDLQTKPQKNDRLTEDILEQDKSKMQVTVKKLEEESLKLREQKPLGTESISSLLESDIKTNATQKYKSLQIPKTSVQFYKGWKSVGANQDLRLRYMKQINPEELPDIFKESLESKVFGEMMETLSGAQDRNLIYNWLTHLTNVKRFSTLTMFMSAADKRRICDLFAYLKEENKFESVKELTKKYEV